MTSGERVDFFKVKLNYCTVFGDFCVELRCVIRAFFNFRQLALFIWQASTVLYRLH